MTGPDFVDTNILVYAFGQTKDKRHSIARALMERLLDSQAAMVSVQVLREFYSVATRKISAPISHRDASGIIRDLAVSCHVVEDTLPQLQRAMEIVNSTPMSIWDASIMAAAEAAGCERVFSEDLAHGLKVGRVAVVNPFVDSV